MHSLAYIHRDLYTHLCTCTQICIHIQMHSHAYMHVPCLHRHTLEWNVIVEVCAIILTLFCYGLWILKLLGVWNFLGGRNHFPQHFRWTQCGQQGQCLVLEDIICGTIFTNHTVKWALIACIWFYMQKWTLAFPWIYWHPTLLCSSLNLPFSLSTSKRNIRGGVENFLLLICHLIVLL